MAAYEAFKKAMLCSNPICYMVALTLCAESDASILKAQLVSLDEAHEKLKAKLGALVAFMRLMSL